MTATPEAINSIEWAVLFSALVLSARLYTLIQASLGVDRAHRQVLDELSRGTASTLQKRTKGLGYQNPYGEFASALINASRREFDSEEERNASTKHALETMTARWTRRTKQGRITDVLALGIGMIVVFYSRGLLPEGPLFWSCAGAMFVTLFSTIGARGLLLSNLLSSAESLRRTLSTRPQLPSLSEGAQPCLWCNAPTRLMEYELRVPGEADSIETSVAQCDHCGKLVTTVDPGELSDLAELGEAGDASESSIPIQSLDD